MTLENFEIQNDDFKSKTPHFSHSTCLLQLGFDK